MATDYTDFRPGDLIAPDIFTFFSTKIAELEDRVAKLESGNTLTPVRITGFNPAVQQNSGRNLTITGSGFAVPAEANTIMLNQTQIHNFTSPNSDTVLNFVIPSDFVPPSNNLVTITISNAQGSTSVLYRILPFVPVPGPDPVIQSVLPVNPAVLILVNAPIHIVGANFAPVGSDNQIFFDVVSGANTVTYPRPGNTLVFNNAQSSTTDIVVTLPDIAEINLGGPIGQRIVTLRLTVGAHPEQRFPFSARRS